MELLWEGLSEATRVLVSLDPLVLGATWRSLWVSSLAVLLATGLGLPLGTLLARRRFAGRSLLVLASRVGMATPTVFLGVLGYALFSRRGPLGVADLLYTPWAIVFGELLLALPITISISHGAVAALDPRIPFTAQTLGAGTLRRWLTYLSEARIGVMLAVLTAFARCVTELGIAMMVGGNIRGHTRTLATAIALETGKGEFGRGLAMGLILLLVALGVTLAIATLGRQSREPA
ncbi:MAG: ABC transporter permease [Deltaproteobacteria bacterium]|nr:ABC transporter permease [Deltaproteobacteria bacterium]